MSIISYLSAWAGIIGGIWLLFSKAENLVESKIKTDISSWLSNLNPEGKLVNWPTTFASVFDSIFGKKHLSWRCFSMSCIASVLSVLMLTILWWALHPKLFHTVDHTVDKSLYIFIILTLCFNIILDYFSLIKTRYIICKYINVNSATNIIVFLFIDLVATAFIFFAGMATIIFIIRYFKDVPADTTLEDLLYVMDIVWAGMNVSGKNIDMYIMGVWFYSTFFTSVWIYLYVISGLIVKAGSFIGILASCTRKIFDIDNKPLRSMGYVCIVCVSIIFLIVPFAKLLF